MKTLLRNLAITGLTICLSATAWAQDGETTTTTDGSFGGSTSTSTTTTSGVLITVGPILTTTLVASSGGSSAQMEQYMRHNATALQQDLNVGGGQTIKDLAQIFMVEPAQEQAFGHILRQHRASLVDLTQVDTLNQDRAGLFISTIIGAMKQDTRFNDSVAKLQG